MEVNSMEELDKYEFYIEIISKEDGAYLAINNPNLAKKVSQRDIDDVVKLYDVKGVNYDIIKEVLEQKEESSTTKISDDPKVAVVNEKIIVEIDKKEKYATMKFVPPTLGGEKITYDDIIKTLNEEGVKFGIDEMLVREALNYHDYTTKHIIANSQNPVDGIAGRLEIYFDTEKKSNKPKLLPNGKVDFRDLNLVIMKDIGDKLIEVIPPIQGKDGTSVRGTVFSHKPGREATLPTLGQNTGRNESSTIIISKISGQVLFNGKKIEVTPILDIPGNVDNTTGNIDFNGTVNIKGMVSTGFSVRAAGNVEIFGVVEGANIYSENDIFLHAGVQGLEKAVIEAKGDINVKYGTHCELISQGNITADSIMHSEVKCGGVLSLSGKNGLLVGGNILAKQSINAQTIGSHMATATNVVVGNNPARMEGYNELLADYVKIKAMYDQNNIVTNKLMKQNEEGTLEEDKKVLLLKSMQAKKILKEKIVYTKEKINNITVKMNSKRGEVSASKVIYSGVNVKIGNTTLYVKDDINNARLRVKEEKIHIGSLN
jgi:uncharacterized protein